MVAFTTSYLDPPAIYSCDEGYMIDGDETRTCGANGEWSGSEPQCVRKLLYTGHNVANCTHICAIYGMKEHNYIIR